MPQFDTTQKELKVRVDCWLADYAYERGPGASSGGGVEEVGDEGGGDDARYDDDDGDDRRHRGLSPLQCWPHHVTKGEGV